jgi:euchromatic histone-lysine N-methyltransferase
VCELVGEFVHHNNKNAGSNLHAANYIFNLGNVFVDDEYLISCVIRLCLSFIYCWNMHFAGFGKGFIDATRYGNIGRFINHSCSPNLCMKDVIYDNYDKSVPHKMLFAVKDIPAGRELCYDYNCFKRNFKVESNNCYCWSSECHGQIYI